MAETQAPNLDQLLTSSNGRGPETNVNGQRDEAGRSHETGEKPTPTHDEIMDIYENGTSQTGVEVALEGIKHGLRANEALEGLNTNCKYLHDVEGFFEEGFDAEGMERSDKPQVFIEPIKGSKPPEHFVLIRLNNGAPDEPEKNTVILATMQADSNGALKVDGSSLVSIMSEEAYSKEVTVKTKGPRSFLHNRKYDTKWMRGELTGKQYKEEYKKKNGMSLEASWKKYDAEFAHENIIERGEAERNKERLLGELRDAYTELGETYQEQDAEEREVIEQVEGRPAETQTETQAETEQETAEKETPSELLDRLTMMEALGQVRDLVSAELSRVSSVNMGKVHELVNGLTLEKSEKDMMRKVAVALVDRMIKSKKNNSSGNGN